MGTNSIPIQLIDGRVLLSGGNVGGNIRNSFIYHPEIID